MQKRDLREIILFPMVARNHFCLMVYSKEEEKMLLLDSMRLFKRSSPEVQNMTKYLQNNLLNVTVRTPSKVPEQRNLVDCGIYTILMAEEFLRQWQGGTKMLQMQFYIEQEEVNMAKENIFFILKTEGLRKAENPDIGECDVDKMWNDN